MATEVLRPDSDGILLEWTPTSPTDHFDEVDEASSDENTTTVLVVAADVTTKSDFWGLAASAIGVSDTINSVTLTLRCLHSLVQPVVNFLWRDNGVNTIGATLALTTSYADYTEVRTVRPSDSAAWTLTDINALEVGIRRTGDATKGACRCTQAFITIDYTPAIVKGRLSLLGVGL